MRRTRMHCWREAGIQTKMLVFIRRVTTLPIVILAVMGFTVSNREAATTRLRYLAERERDFRPLAEHPGLAGDFATRAANLTAQPESSRQALERALQLFAERGNHLEPVDRRCRAFALLGQNPTIGLLDGFAAMAHPQQNVHYRPLRIMLFTAQTRTTPERAGLQQNVCTGNPKPELDRKALLQEVRGRLQAYDGLRPRRDAAYQDVSAS